MGKGDATGVDQEKSTAGAACEEAARASEVKKRAKEEWRAYRKVAATAEEACAAAQAALVEAQRIASEVPGFTVEAKSVPDGGENSRAAMKSLTMDGEFGTKEMEWDHAEMQKAAEKQGNLLSTWIGQMDQQQAALRSLEEAPISIPAPSKKKSGK